VPAPSAPMRYDSWVPSHDADEFGSHHRRLAELAAAELQPWESIVALLPFATVPKRGKGPEGKVRVGIRQSWRRYRPLVVTDRRLLVFDSGRTPDPRGLLAAFALAEVTMSPPVPRRFGATVFELTLPGEGAVPFETGRRDDLAGLQAAVAG
jgi:hypothetical protein